MKTDELYFDRERFKQMRIAKKVSQYEMAFDLDIRQCKISQIETGSCLYPHLKIIVKATRYFNCKLEDLILIRE